MRARVLVHDRLLRRPTRRIAHVNRAGGRQRLDARGRVDDVARHHPFALGADRHRRLAGENAGPSPELRGAELVTQRRHRGDKVERGPHGAFGIVLGRDRGAPDGHHRVPDELLDGAAVELDQPAAAVEVPRLDLPDLLRVTRLGQHREADEIREQHRHEATLRRRLCGRRHRGRGRRRSVGAQWRTALVAERLLRLGSCSARGAGPRQRGTTATAELRAGAVLGAALRATGHGRRVMRPRRKIQQMRCALRPRGAVQPVEHGLLLPGGESPFEDEAELLEHASRREIARRGEADECRE